MNIDRGRSAVLHATWAASEPEGTPFLGSAAATSALVCGRTYDCAAAENVQIHGGIGFTWEHSAHRYFRRAKTDLVLLADEAYYVDRLLTSVGA
jgi:alkylation response protein AidB-like acyl-CoA dehydrogenase